MTFEELIKRVNKKKKYKEQDPIYLNEIGVFPSQIIYHIDLIHEGNEKNGRLLYEVKTLSRLPLEQQRIFGETFMYRNYYFPPETLDYILKGKDKAFRIENPLS